MKTFYITTILVAFLQSVVLGDDKIIKKRQIYREQVLPHAGGKIPDTAFQTDRLLLNRLQKEGISVPDGIVLEQRNPQVFPYTNRAMRTVFRVAATSDGRYTPDVGKYVYDKEPTIETTYLYPQIHNHPLSVPADISINVPVYRPFEFPNPLLSRNELKPKKKTVYLVTYGSKAHQHKTYHNSLIQSSYKPIESVSTLNVIGDPLTGFSWSQFQQDYLTSQILDDFDGFFPDSYGLRHIRSPHKQFKSKLARTK